MTSKWIDELEDEYADGGDWEDILPILERINSLLSLAVFSTDDSLLVDKIIKEIENVT